jgi:hypothetical protein
MGAFEHGDGGIFKILRLIQNLHQSAWDHEILKFCMLTDCLRMYNLKSDNFCENPKKKGM